MSIKTGDKVTIDLSGKPTEVEVTAVGEDGTIFGVIDEKTVIQFKIAHAEKPKRNVFKSLFTVGNKA